LPIFEVNANIYYFYRSMANESARTSAIDPEIFDRKIKIAPYIGKLLFQFARGFVDNWAGRFVDSRSRRFTTDVIHQNFQETAQVKQGIRCCDEFFLGMIASLFTMNLPLLVNQPGRALGHSYPVLVQSKQHFHAARRTRLDNCAQLRS